MEPEVHIIEKYYQEIKNCFTMTNILLEGRREIDVLAIDPKTPLKRYHIEVSAWTERYDKVKEDWLDWFHKKKFEYSTVKQKIREVFGGDVTYEKVWVVWNIKNEEVRDVAKKKFGIEIRLMKEILEELQKAVSSDKIKGSRDDILRTVELVTKSYEMAEKKSL